MNRIYMLIISLFMLMPYGCKPTHVENLLSEAESVMEENPEKALSLLDSINDVNLNSRKLKAKHGLLRTQAMVKTDIQIESDSLINESVIFYSNKSESPDYMKSLFYQGQVRFYLGQYDSAIVPATKAREIAIKLKDHYWQAKAAELIADIYAQCYLHEEVIKYTEETVIEYYKANKENNKLFALANLGLAYYECSEANDTALKTKGINLLDSIYQLSNRQLGNEWLNAFAAESLIPAYINTGNLNKANQLINKLDSMSCYISQPLLFNCWKAQCLINSNEYEKGLKQLKDSEHLITNDMEKSFVLTVYDIFYKRNGNLQEHAKCVDSLLLLQNQAIHSIVKQSALSKLNDNANLEVKQRDISIKELNILVIVIIVSSIIIVSILLIIIRLKNKIRKNEIDQYLETIYSLNDDLKKLNNTVESNEIERQNLLSKISDDRRNKDEILEKLFRDKWIYIDNLCTEFMGKGDDVTLHSSVPKYIKKEIEYLKSNKAQKEMISLINEHMGNIVTLIHEEGEFLSDEHDEIIFALISIGFSPKTISLLTGIKLKTVFTRKYRIRDRISRSNTPYKERFLLKLQ